MKSKFIYNLEDEEEVKDIDKYEIGVFYGIRYLESDNGIIVELGDGYRHEMFLEAKYWNKILRIIKNGEIDKDGIEAIVFGLMRTGIHRDYAENLISAIKKGIIKEAF